MPKLITTSTLWLEFDREQAVEASAISREVNQNEDS
jgi:hypothetical protein